MIKVITYGTFDLLHIGHIKLLERAKQLGDFLIVGVTADGYDQLRGKINVQQSLIERIEAVKATGLADQIIVEEYEGQKIDDIKKYGVDIFAIGSDWKGKFDYISDYCRVIYLERTRGISSSEIRSKNRNVNLGIKGDLADFLSRFQRESKYVNGVEINSICTDNIIAMSEEVKSLPFVTDDYSEFLKNLDAVYIHGSISSHYELTKKALESGKNVLCESPVCETKEQCAELFKIADENNLVLMDAIRSAYSTAYERLILMVKTGAIGRVLSVDVTCTNMNSFIENKRYNSFKNWGPNAMLPIFQLLGTDYDDFKIYSRFDKNGDDVFTRVNFGYKSSTASVKVAEGAKSEGELIITGDKGYIYVPAPWWKTDYFEVRYENQNENKRFFYQLDGEGIRYELVAFIRAIENKKIIGNIDKEVSLAICDMMDNFNSGKNLVKI